MPARLPGSAFLVAPPPAARVVEQAQAKALTDWGHPSPPAPPAASTAPAPGPLLRQPLFGGAAQEPEELPPREPDVPEAAALFQAAVGGPHPGRWLVGGLALVAAAAMAVWVVRSRRAEPEPLPPAVAQPAAPESPTRRDPPAPPAVAAADPAPAATGTPPVSAPALAGSPQRDAPTPAPAEGPGEAEYRAAVAAAREANAASKWELEAEEYRRALSVRPSSLEAKEGLGAAIVKSSGKAGSYLEAERLLADVVTADAARSRAWLVLGMARQLGARPAPAVEAYRRYLELVPQGPTSADVRAVVRELDRRDVAQRRSGR
jgi:hypothetical protein